MGDIDKMELVNKNAPVVANDYPIVFDKNQNYTHGSRRLNSVSFGNQTLQLPTPLKVYSKIEDGAFHAKAGETVTPSFGFTGEWMHGFVYLDRGQDGTFEATLNANGSIPEGSDIMAFSYAEPSLGSGTGYNSKGERVTNSNVLNPPAFTVPTDMTPGFYRMRYKVDWASIDPAGRAEDGNGIIKNGGAICDVVLNVHNDNGALEVVAENGALLAADGSQLSSEVPFGQSLAVKVVPADGYCLDVLTVLHGHNLDGEPSIHGVAQYDELVMPAYTLDGDVVTIPAEYVDGDMRITAQFVQQQGGDAGDGYALMFDKGAVAANTHNISIGVNGAVLKVSGNVAYYDMTSMPVLLAGTRNVLLDVDGVAGKDAYLYIDLNNDGRFAVMIGADGTPGISSELVAFSCHNGIDSNGDAAQSGTSVSMPMYKLGSVLPDGVYRARLKLDSGNLNPAGSETFVDEGGVVVDFLLNLLTGDKSLALNTVDGSIDGENYTALPMTVTPGKGFTAVLRGAPGFVCKELVVRHGNNVDGEQYINGNMQWREDVLPVVDGKAAVSAQLVDGDVVLSAEFVQEDGSEWQLVFSDEFNAEDMSQPVSEKWMRCQRQGATWNRWLSDSKEVIYLQGGDLVARAIPNPDKVSDPVPMITGGIKSDGHFGFTYGYVEARIKSNPWTGNFPAFWMMPEDRSAGWPDCGEIDIWETIDAQERSWHTIHSNWTYDLGYKNNPQSSFNVYTSHDRYHTYGLMWAATTLIWYVDGKEVGRYTKSTNQSHLNQGQWPFDKHFHVILNQSVGNNAWAADADVTHTYETRFDWVRVYQTPGMKNTNGTVGVNAVHTEASVSAVAVEGGVMVLTDSATDVAVYDLQGRKIAESVVCGMHTFALQRGAYIVADTKIIVK